jgi:hypothetical protein
MARPFFASTPVRLICTVPLLALAGAISAGHGREYRALRRLLPGGG